MPSEPSDPLDFAESSKQPPPSVEDLNALIPDYEFLYLIDRGGMGCIYKAKERNLKRIVAVKLLPPSLLKRSAFVQQFKTEAEALAQLNHPNIVRVYRLGQTANGWLYYVMEYVDGPGDLSHLLKDDKLTPAQRLKVVIQVSEALQFAHQHHIVHRDIKPSNILIDANGNAKVADFGLAKMLGPEQFSELTRSLGPMGTPEYVAPEALNPKATVDHRADIYSLGVMLYEMLTGRVPKGKWEPPSRRGADERLDSVVERALQEDPGKRFQEVGEFTAVIEPLAHSTLAEAARSARVGRGASITTLLPRRDAERPPWLAISGWIAIFTSSAFWWLPPIWQHLRLMPDPAFSVSAAAIDHGEPEKPHDRQVRLARWVVEHHGSVNIQTPYQLERRMDYDYDIATETRLPATEFTIWRVNMAEDPALNDDELKELLAECEKAGTVENINLIGTNITARGLAALEHVKATLTSLNLVNTPAFTAESIPSITSCPKLHWLFASQRPPGGESGSTTVAELAQQVRQKLPGCEISLK